MVWNQFLVKKYKTATYMVQGHEKSMGSHCSLRNNGTTDDSRRKQKNQEKHKMEAHSRELPWNGKRIVHNDLQLAWFNSLHTSDIYMILFYIVHQKLMSVTRHTSTFRRNSEIFNIPIYNCTLRTFLENTISFSLRRALKPKSDPQ